MNGDRLTRNAFMAALQVMISGGVLFLLYRYLLRTIGAEQMGIWAVVQATASVSRIGEMGFSGSAVKYTAKYIARNETDKAAEVIQTTVATIGVVLACILAIGYPLIAWLMGKLIPRSHISDALAILPYVMASTWISTIAGIFLSGLDGCQRMDRRARVSMLSSVLLLVLAWLLVPSLGLRGIALAQIGQGLLLLLLGWALLRRELPTLPRLVPGWSAVLFREMFRYGFNFQLITLLGMLADPLTKALMTKFGGLASTAYYEMANRMVAQFRSLLVAANEAVVPQVAGLHENFPEEIGRMYAASYRTIFFLSLPLYAVLASLVPMASELWIGRYEARFAMYALLLTLAYWINTLAGPAYFVNLGTGRLGWNIGSFVLLAVLNMVLGYFLGLSHGGTGVAWGYALAIMMSGGLIMLGYHRDQQVPLAGLLPDESRGLLLACCLGLLAAWGMFTLMEEFAGALAQAVLCWLACMAIIVPAFWKHPLREKIHHRFAFAFRS